MGKWEMSKYTVDQLNNDYKNDKKLYNKNFLILIYWSNKNEQ